MVESETLEENPAEVEKLRQYDGILIPTALEKRGIEGKYWQSSSPGKTISLSGNLLGHAACGYRICEECG